MVYVLGLRDMGWCVSCFSFESFATAAFATCRPQRLRVPVGTSEGGRRTVSPSKSCEWEDDTGLVMDQALAPLEAAHTWGLDRYSLSNISRTPCEGCFVASEHWPKHLKDLLCYFDDDFSGSMVTVFNTVQPWSNKYYLRCSYNCEVIFHFSLSIIFYFRGLMALQCTYLQFVT